MRLFPRIGLSLLVVAVLAPGSASASWLGLADGTYDITLEPSELMTGVSGTGSLTIQGNGISDWDIQLSDFPGSFTGDPTDSALRGGTSEGTMTFPAGLETETIAFTLITGTWLVDNLPGTLPTEDFGRWSATLQNPTPVPEPGPLALMMLGLIGLAWTRRPRHREGT